MKKMEIQIDEGELYILHGKAESFLVRMALWVLNDEPVETKKHQSKQEDIKNENE